jgi:membrane fusion protein, multidrug efflux system
MPLPRPSPRVAVALGAGVATLLAATLWLFDRAGAVHTSDARVHANMVTVSSSVAGRIADIPVSAGQVIEAGQALAQLDDREARLEVAALQLELEALEGEVARETLRAGIAHKRGRSRVGSREASLAAARADLTAAKALLATAESEHARITRLKLQGLATQPAMDQADARLNTARQDAARAAASIAEGKAGVGEAAAEAAETQVIRSDADVLSLRAEMLKQQVALKQVELEHHTLGSPVSGVVDEVFADEGEYITPGARIALVHDPADVWIEANIKETEIGRVLEGAHVSISLDALPGESCSGRVEHIRSAAAAEFALIPNANPTGVFTKITQRIPVRIALGEDCPRARPGSMATLKIRAK